MQNRNSQWRNPLEGFKSFRVAFQKVIDPVIPHHLHLLNFPRYKTLRSSCPYAMFWRSSCSSRTFKWIHLMMQLVWMRLHVQSQL